MTENGHQSLLAGKSKGVVVELDKVESQAEFLEMRKKKFDEIRQRKIAEHEQRKQQAEEKRDKALQVVKQAEDKILAEQAEQRQVKIEMMHKARNPIPKKNKPKKEPKKIHQVESYGERFELQKDSPAIPPSSKAVPKTQASRLADRVADDVDDDYEDDADEYSIEEETHEDSDPRRKSGVKKGKHKHDPDVEDDIEEEIEEEAHMRNKSPAGRAMSAVGAPRTRKGKGERGSPERAASAIGSNRAGAFVNEGRKPQKGVKFAWKNGQGDQSSQPSEDDEPEEQIGFLSPASVPNGYGKKPLTSRSMVSEPPPRESQKKNKPRVSRGGVYKERSNKKLIQNAINYVCLAGEAQKSDRSAVLTELEFSSATSFLVILKKNRTLTFGGLYTLNLASKTATKLWGDGPTTVGEGMIAEYYKFSSAGKTWEPMNGLTSFAPTTDAISLLPNVYKQHKRRQQ